MGQLYGFQSALGLTTKGNTFTAVVVTGLNSFNPPLASRPRETHSFVSLGHALFHVSIRPWPHDQGKPTSSAQPAQPLPCFNPPLASRPRETFQRLRPSWPRRQCFNPPLASRPRETSDRSQALAIRSSMFQSALGLTTKGNLSRQTEARCLRHVSIRPWPHDQGKPPAPA